MSNSPLVSHVNLSPNHYNGRAGRKITKITPHHVSGVCSVETLGNIFAPTSRQASSNYGIGNDGRVGMYVEEHNAPWTSSSYNNDTQAVTIEVSNSQMGGQWPVSDAAWNTLVDLCVDICKRNGIPKLVWTGGPDGTLTMHKMFASTDCPGPYLEKRMPELARLVNERLAGKTEDTVEKPKERIYEVKPINNNGGDVYRLYNEKDGSHLYTTDANEKNSLAKAGWKSEGVVFKAPKGGTKAVYRLYNPNSGRHHFTADYNEAATLEKAGWALESVPFFGMDSGTAVYRLYNPNNEDHLWTKDANEKAALIKAGWKDEGIGFYV